MYNLFAPNCDVRITIDGQKKNKTINRQSKDTFQYFKLQIHGSNRRISKNIKLVTMQCSFEKKRMKFLNTNILSFFIVIFCIEKITSVFFLGDFTNSA